MYVYLRWLDVCLPKLGVYVYLRWLDVCVSKVV